MLFRRVLIVACCAVFLVLAAYPTVTAFAGVGFQPISSEELKMTNEPLAPGAPAIILYRQVDRDDSGRGTVHEDDYYRVKILTDEGRKYANIEIPFVKDLDEVVHIRARTIKTDGSVVEFGDKVFEKSVFRSRALRVLVKAFTMPAVEAGCIIEYSYTLDLRRAYASHWILSENLFTKSARFSLKPYRASYTPLALRWSWQSLPPGAEPKEGPDHIIRMEVSNVSAFQTEDFMPPPNQLKSRVDFAYEAELSAHDPDEFWKNVGKKRDDALEKFLGKANVMEGAVGQIVSASDSSEVKLRKIYDRVQHIRNTSFEFRKTQQEQEREKEKIDETVQDVWTRGYGDKRQLDWLFLALVRAAGFEAYGCWLSSRAEYFFTPKTMESGHLNETAVLVKLNGRDLYFNPGAEFAPFGLLNWSETGTPGLRLDRDGGTWIKTTLPASAESRVERKAELRLSEAGDLEGKLTVTYTGLEAMYHRLDVRHLDEVARKKLLEDRMKTQAPVATVAELTNQPDWNGSETPLVAEFDVKIPGWSSNAGKHVLIPAAIFTAAEKHIFEHADRVHPIYVEYPYEKVDEVTIEIPPGWQIESVPPAQEQDKGRVAYTLKAEGSKGTLHLTRKLKVDFMILDSKNYPALRSFFEAVRTGDEEQIVLQPGIPKAND